jgi:single-strand DNA-binding protein
MSGLNHVILIGNAGNDPEVKYTPGGTTIANFSLATSERFKNRDGETEDRTEWHRVVFYGRAAEICKDYLHKGDRVCVEGKIHYRSWEDRDTGEKKYMTEITGRQLVLLGNTGNDGKQQGGNQSRKSGGGKQTGGRKDPGPPPDDYPADDDLPF